MECIQRIIFWGKEVALAILPMDFAKYFELIPKVSKTSLVHLSFSSLPPFAKKTPPDSSLFQNTFQFRFAKVKVWFSRDDNMTDLICISFKQKTYYERIGVRTFPGNVTVCYIQWYESLPGILSRHYNVTIVSNWYPICHNDKGCSCEWNTPAWTCLLRVLATWDFHAKVAKGKEKDLEPSQQTGFQQPGFWITMIGFWIPLAGFRIPQTKITWIPDFGLPCMGRYLTSHIQRALME